ncbi:MAG TPA: acyltransferase [Nocardioidaceae bacterium]|nr:acyltransferase [Nocardioidaceae bacterium]
MVLQTAGMQPTGERWRLGHRPALDGLRGIAVILVVVHHAAPTAWPAAGTVGVTIFFTLSGFLITSLLLEEAGCGGIRVGRFYLRRAARLVPALAALLVVSTALSAVGSAQLTEGSIVAAGTYTANWVAASGTMLGALQHTWSLAIEEQFYLLWPLVLLAVGRRPLLLAGICVSGIVGSLSVKFWMYDGTPESVWRVYFGSDARADALLWGCLLAVALRSTRTTRALPAISSAALLVCLLASFDSSYAARNVLWPSVIPVVTTLVLFAVVRGGYRGWLTSRPIVLVGRRSYGLYLWHYPVFVLFDAPLVAELGLAWALTLLSWRLVEAPAQRWLHRGERTPAESRLVVVQTGGHAT